MLNRSSSLHALHVDSRLHRATVVESCAPEAAEWREPKLARPVAHPPSRVFRDEPVPPGFLRAMAARLVGAIVLVSICFAVATVGFTMALPKPPAELPRAIAKVAP